MPVLDETFSNENPPKVGDLYFISRNSSETSHLPEAGFVIKTTEIRTQSQGDTHGITSQYFLVRGTILGNLQGRTSSFFRSEQVKRFVPYEQIRGKLKSIQTAEFDGYTVSIVTSPDEFKQNWQLEALKKFARQHKLNIFIFDRIFDKEKYAELITSPSMKPDENIIIFSYMLGEFLGRRAQTYFYDSSDKHPLYRYVDSQHLDIAEIEPFSPIKHFYMARNFFESAKGFRSSEKLREIERKQHFKMALSILHEKYSSRSEIVIGEEIPDFELQLKKASVQKLKDSIIQTKAEIVELDDALRVKTMSLLNQQEQLNTLTNTEIFSKKQLLKQLEQIRSHPQIAKVGLEFNKAGFFMRLTIQTIPLFINLNSGQVPIGRITFAIQLSNAECDDMIFKAYTTLIVHPHVNESSICFGGFLSAITNARIRFNLAGIVETMIVWSSTYNPGDTYGDHSPLEVRMRNAGIYMSEIEFMSKPEDLAEVLVFDDETFDEEASDTEEPI